MTTQPKRERKSEAYTEDEHDPILSAAEDMANFLQARAEGEAEAAMERPGCGGWTAKAG